MADSRTVLFAGPAQDDIRLETLGVLTACYHRPSGRTHLLMEPSPEILSLIAGRTMTAGAVAAELDERFDLSEDEGSAPEAVLAARLAELVEAGLAVRIVGGEAAGDA